MCLEYLSKCTSITFQQCFYTHDYYTAYAKILSHGEICQRKKNGFNLANSPQEVQCTSVINQTQRLLEALIDIFQAASCLFNKWVVPVSTWHVCIQWQPPKHKTGSNRFRSYISAYKLQKHSLALYIRHFTQQLVGCRPLSLRKKARFDGYIPVSFLFISSQQHG